MNIFIQIKNSIYNKEYYQSTVLNQSLRSSVKYLAKLSLLVALLGCVVFSVALPRLIVKAKGAITSTVDEYPNDLIVTLKDGNVSINKPEPYIVKVPESLSKPTDSNSPKIENLIVINTTEPFSLDKFKSYATYILITKTEVVSMQSKNGEIKISSLDKLGNLEITKSWVMEKEAVLMKILPSIISIIVVLMFIGISIGLFVATLIALLFSAIIVWLIFKIKKTEITYKKSYQVALHASTIILIICIFNSYLGFFGNSFFKLLIFVILIIINFDGYKTIKSEEPIVPLHNDGVNNL